MKHGSTEKCTSHTTSKDDREDGRLDEAISCHRIDSCTTDLHKRYLKYDIKRTFQSCCKVHRKDNPDRIQLNLE